MEKFLYFDCFSGISGDMALAGLVDLGFPSDKMRRGLDNPCLKDYSLKIIRGYRNGMWPRGLRSEGKKGKIYSSADD